MAEASQKLILESFKKFLTSGDYSDLTITCQADSYKVHKIVVCSRAKFLKKAIEFGGQESESGIVDLPADDPEMIKLLVQYLYEGEYVPTLLPPKASKGTNNSQCGHKQAYNSPHTCDGQNSQCYRSQVCDHHHCGSQCSFNCINFICQTCNPAPLTNGEADQLATHARMYALGDKYEVLGLKQLCKEKFNHACEQFWDDPQFAIGAHIVFSTTIEDDKGLRNIVSKTISNHMNLVNKPEIEAMMTEFNGLAFGLLKQKVSEGWF